MWSSIPLLVTGTLKISRCQRIHRMSSSSNQSGSFLGRPRPGLVLSLQCSVFARVMTLSEQIAQRQR